MGELPPIVPAALRRRMVALAAEIGAVVEFYGHVDDVTEVLGRIDVFVLPSWMEGTPLSLLEALSAYGLALGEAFQLRDDLLGVFGDAALTGKPAGDDLREGKRTLLVALALEEASAEQSSTVATLLGRADLDDAGVAALRAVLTSTGADRKVEQHVTEGAAAARAALERAPGLDTEFRQALNDLVVHRHTGLHCFN